MADAIITTCEHGQASRIGDCERRKLGNGRGMIDRPETIGERLRKLRDAVGVNQAAMAQRLGITQSAWSQYESGKRRVTLEVADAAVARFGVTLDWIYRGDPSGLPMKLADLLN